MSLQHQVKVGESLVEQIDGHAARTDSPEFVHARATMHKILATNPTVADLYAGPAERAGASGGHQQAHHGGSLWVFDGSDWYLYLSPAGVEWSCQFAVDPARLELVRRNAAKLYERYPETLPEMERLGYHDLDILTTPITDAAGVARWVDSIFNSCVPIPAPGHVGFVRPATPTAAGVHNYPGSVVDLVKLMRSDFVPFVTDPGTGTAVVVAPVAPRGSGDGRVRVVFAEPGHPLAALKAEAKASGQAVILAPDSPIAQAAFSQQ